VSEVTRGTEEMRVRSRRLAGDSRPLHGRHAWHEWRASDALSLCASSAACCKAAGGPRSVTGEHHVALASGRRLCDFPWFRRWTHRGTRFRHLPAACRRGIKM